MFDNLIVQLIPIGILLALLVAISPLVFVAMWVHRWINRENNISTQTTGDSTIGTTVRRQRLPSGLTGSRMDDQRTDRTSGGSLSEAPQRRFFRFRIADLLMIIFWWSLFGGLIAFMRQFLSYSQDGLAPQEQQ